MGVDPDLVPALSAQQLVDRDSQCLTFYIVECDINGTQRSHYCSTPEMEAAVHILPVVLDIHGVLSNQIFPKGLNHLSRGQKKAPVARLAQTRDPFIGQDLDKQKLIDRDDFYISDFHLALLLIVSVPWQP